LASEPASRAAELAAQQVESIVAASQAAADELRREAEQQAEAIRSEARLAAERELEEMRAESIRLGQDARQEAQNLVNDAKKESAEIREQTARAVEGRVADAEQKASQVMSEAETLSLGLRRLGESLTDQGGRILRDVHNAHRRMQADLRVMPVDRGEPARRSRTDRAPAGDRERSGGGQNPFEGLDVPDWVGRER
jgi:hypothetical protein